MAPIFGFRSDSSTKPINNQLIISNGDFVNPRQISRRNRRINLNKKSKQIFKITSESLKYIPKKYNISFEINDSLVEQLFALKDKLKAKSN